MQPTRSQSSLWRWWAIGLLFLATGINYMDRSALSGASVNITHELGLDEAQYGDLELAFGWAYAAGSLVFGFLSDRFSLYWLYPTVLVAWSFSGMATAWSQGFGGLLVCRTLLGFFEAGHYPCALKTTFALMEEKERTLGNSFMQGGASIGAVLTPQVLKFLLSDQPGSWRSTFVIVDAAGLIWVVLWFLIVKPRDFARPQPSSAPVAPAPIGGETLGAILRSRRFWAVALVLIGAQTVWHIYRVWLMKFLQTGRGYAESAALDFNSVYYIATDVGCLVSGVVSLWLVRRGLTPHGSRRAVFAGGCALTSLSVLLPWLGHGWPLLAILMLIGAGSLALFPCYYSFVQELSPHYVGRLTGLLSMGIWAVTSPMHTFFGMLADRTKSYDAGLVLAGLAPWIGVLAMKGLWTKPGESAVTLLQPNPSESYAD